MARRIVFKTIGLDEAALLEKARSLGLTTPQEITKLSVADPFIDYRETILNVLCRPSDPKVGLTGREVVDLVRIAGIVSDAKAGFVVIEDADHKKLKDKLDKYAWTIAHPNIVEFIDDIEKAEVVDISKAPAKTTAAHNA